MVFHLTNWQMISQVPVRQTQVYTSVLQMTWLFKHVLAAFINEIRQILHYKKSLILGAS